MGITQTLRNVGLAVWLVPIALHAHEGEDHSQDKASAPKTVSALVQAGRESPARLPDGSVFLPKVSQLLLGVRTTLTSLGDVNQTVSLKGHVRADPSAGGQVQATQVGRIVGGPAGLPALGQKVKAGQVLAWLEPVVSSLERSSQQAQLAQIQSQLAQAERRVARYSQLEGSVPQKEIEAAKLELQAYRQQQAALSSGLNSRLPLTAPVSGVVSKVTVVAGQVVEARQSIFDIVNPDRLIVEALGYDARLIGNIANVSGSTESGARLSLTLLGTGLELREQALPIHLKVRTPAPALVIGQPVKVFAQLKETKKGVLVPATAVTKGASGEQLVWVHAAIERFVPKKVQLSALDANNVVVTDGLAGGERVVVQGVASLNQVR
ncbi:MAG: efflux RND transporter periplasmic adaptor subunit [Burkholderiales bacterium]|nr:efflux RND transporter periplasmic adaptor subunit [Burkholderiales bacterium]